MQTIVAELVRWIGFGILRVVTLSMWIVLFAAAWWTMSRVVGVRSRG